MPDHVHMLIAVPPKYVVFQVVEYIKEKGAKSVRRVQAGLFWAEFGQKARPR